MNHKQELLAFISTELVRGLTHPLTDDDELLAGGLVDSLGIVRLVQFIDEELGVHVPLEEVTLENFGTLGLLVAYLAKRAES